MEAATGSTHAQSPEPAAVEPVARRLDVHRREFLVIAVIVAIVRGTYSWGRVSFLLSPDEFAIGGMARYLSGTGSWNMFAASTWRPGMSTVLVPVAWLTDDPELFVRISLLVAAVIAGWSAMWLAAIGERVTELRGLALGVAVVAVMSLPAALSATSYVWAEPLVTLTFLAGVHCTMRFSDTRSLTFAAAAIGWSVLGYTTHGRMLPFVVVTVVVIVGQLLRSRRWLEALGAAAAGTFGVVLSDAFANHVFAAVWEVEGSENTVGTVIDRLTDPVEILDAVVGQTWYLLATTLGIAAFGLAALGERALAPDTGRHRPARVLLALTLPMFAVSIVFISGRVRADYFVYGRYNDAIAYPLLIAGVGWLFSGDRRGAWRPVALVVGLTGAMGLMVHQLHAHQMKTGAVLPMIAGLQPIVPDSGSVPVLAATLLAVGLTAAIALSVRRGGSLQRWGAAGALCIVVSAAVASRDVLPPTTNPNASAVAITAVTIPPDATIYVSLISERFDPVVPFTLQRSRALAYQWYLAGHDFELLLPAHTTPGTIVIATESDAHLRSMGAEVIWDDPDFPTAMWRLP